MQSLAAFVMRGQWQAALVAAVAAVLSILVPPALIVSGAPVALMTLRQGNQQGILLVIMASLGTMILALPVFATAAPLVGVFLLLFWLPVWGLAMALRTTVSLAWTLHLAAVLGGLAVLAFYVVLGDPGSWWLVILNELKPVFEAAGLLTDEAVFNEVLQVLAPLMPGLTVANLLAYMLFGLLLGRWWQALLFNPGGFRDEFHDLRLGQGMAVVAAVLFALALTLRWPLLVNLALVVGVIYVLQGIALVHGIVAKARLSRGWLVGFYILLFFALPQVLVLLCLLGIIDAWADLRARFSKPPTGMA